MTLFLLKFGKWILSKSAVTLIAIALVVGGFALYLYVGDSLKIERERIGLLAEAQANAQAAYSRLDGIHSEIQTVAGDLESALGQLETAHALVERLEGFLSKIEYLFSTAEEKAAVDNQLANGRADSTRLGPLIDRLRGRNSELRITRAGLSEEARILEERIVKLESSSSEVAQYVDLSWETVRPYLPYALAGIIFGPFLLKAFAYYAIAPIFQRAEPIRFSKEALEGPSALDGGVSVALILRENERAWIKESYLQASDEHLDRKNRFVLNWQIPFTCVAAGLVELIEFTLQDATSSGRITASTQNEANMELSLIDIPEGGSIILRPSHLIGLVSTNGSPVIIRRRWSFVRAQAWMTLQFRYFEFVGPCRLVVAGIRGVRMERLDPEQIAGRRTNQNSTIGFTPDLDFGAVRAETFWAYFRGFNPLFDDVFRGKGTFFCQEISKGQESGPARFWASIRDAALKVLGV
ncbi:MAG: hypothetical protein OSB19_12135 [Opitutaceae bacterium]|nr:hypothetical protein [Opitutaceae bacterium]